MLKKYASYFVAYVLNNLKGIENIERIVLYGSVARGEAEKESDVDLFFEVKKKTKKFEKEVKDVEERFYSSRESALFKVKEIDNKFSIKIGKLEEWKELSGSIASTGIVLYGAYEIKKLPSNVRQFVIVYWSKIGKNRGAFLNKVYGFKSKDKAYEGLLDKLGGKRMGKSCVMFPVEYKKEIFKLLEKYKVEAKNLEVFRG